MLYEHFTSYCGGRKRELVSIAYACANCPGILGRYRVLRDLCTTQEPERRAHAHNYCLCLVQHSGLTSVQDQLFFLNACLFLLTPPVLRKRLTILETVDLSTPKILATVPWLRERPSLCQIIFQRKYAFVRLGSDEVITKN